MLQKQFPSIEGEWENILTLSNRYLLTPALFVCLRDKGLLDNLDAILFEFIQEVYQQNKKRNQQLLKQIQTISEVLKKHDIQPILLKGIGALAQDLFGDIGCRAMLDIDILVEEDQLETALDALLSAGYYTTYKNENKDAHHLPRLFHKDEPAGLELHRKVFSRSSEAVLPTQTITQVAKIVTPWGHDLPVQILSIEHQIIHNFIHCQISHQNFDTYRLDLRQMFHFAVLSCLPQQNIHWLTVETEMERHGYGDIYRVYLENINTLFALDNPLDHHSCNAYKYLNLAIERIGKPLGKIELFKMEWTHFKHVFSPERLGKRFGAKSALEVFWYAIKHLMRLVYKNIICGGFKRRVEHHHYNRVIGSNKKHNH